MKELNKLQGKTIVWNGDSICQGSKVWGNWATRIAEWNDMTFKNYGIGGGTVTEQVLKSDGVTPRHSVCGTIDKMYEEFPDADYVILEGGTNDADLLGSLVRDTVPPRMGEIDMTDYSGEYDATTFCGALDSMFCRATRHWKGKKIGYIVAQKMGFRTNGYTDDCNNRRAYFAKAIKACEKWGIPYINLWDGCPLNPQLPWFYNKELDVDGNIKAGSFYIDGQHLTSAGYDFTADVIDSWLKTL